MDDTYRACLLGGALGDALGAAIEFMSWEEIQSVFGADGVTDFASAYGRVGAITDDTQMTLFTAEGVLRALVRLETKGITTVEGVTAMAYLRWLYTQNHKKPPTKKDVQKRAWLDGWLITVPELYHRRAPGNACLTALESMEATDEHGGPARNGSKGCGGVMRMAPVGLATMIDDPYAMGMHLAALTHGHPTGQIAAGAFAFLLRTLLEKPDARVEDAVDATRKKLTRSSGHEETAHKLAQAMEFARDASLAPNEAIEKIGEGWVAEEALAIAVYCSLKAADFREGVLMAVNHCGDSDSTGSIAGNILGLRFGLDAIPQRWLERLELREVIDQIARDLSAFREWPRDAREEEALWVRYPGW